MKATNRWGVGKIVLLVLAGLCMGLVLSAQFDLTEQLNARGEGEEKQTSKITKEQDPFSTTQVRNNGEQDLICLPDFTTLAEIIDPSVVNISTTQIVKGRGNMRGGFRFPGGKGFGQQEQDPFQEFFDRFFQGGPQGGMKRQSLGSGFIIDKTGYILTNNHVIKDADSITVLFRDESEAEAKVIGKDPKTDLALIKVETDKKLTEAALGDSDALKMGDWVLAIGNPFGLKYTLTAGIVSAKGREIGAGPYDDFIQTDASINPGNSGGPLINMKGEVIGINTAIIAGGTGIGFAIPINMVRGLLPQLKDKGRVSRGWLGVYIQKVTPELAKSFGLKKPMGALISEITKDGPVYGSELKRGDVIIGYQGKPVEHFNDLPRMVADTRPGTKIELKVLSKGKEKNVKITLGELPEEDVTLAKEESGEEFGLELQQITPELARAHDLPSNKGLIVTNIDPQGAANDAGLHRGDIILEINQKPINTIAEFKNTVKASKKGAMILFLIQRRDGFLYIAVENK